MKDYDYIANVLANYFSVDVGHSEDEAIALLKKHACENQELADGLRQELRAALVDKDCSWVGLLSEFNVAAIEDESAARRYAKNILWDPIFGSEGPV